MKKLTKWCDDQLDVIVPIFAYVFFVGLLLAMAAGLGAWGYYGLIYEEPDTRIGVVVVCDDKVIYDGEAKDISYREGIVRVFHVDGHVSHYAGCYGETIPLEGEHEGD